MKPSTICAMHVDDLSVFILRSLSQIDIESCIEAFTSGLSNGNGSYPFLHVHFFMSSSITFETLTPSSNEVFTP